MIEEVQVISPGGIPIYYNKKDGDMMELSDHDFLQASFLSAIGNFAKELHYGELRTIVLENKTYLLRKGADFSIIFAGDDDLSKLEDKLENVFAFMEFTFSQHNLSNDEINMNDYEPAILAFDKHLKEQSILKNTKFIKPKAFRQKVDSILFKSVGYIPGECNIGKSERYWRLSWGLAAIVVSMALLLVMIALELPRSYRLWLYFINAGAFIGILQFYHRFCVNNGMKKQYVMV